MEVEVKVKAEAVAVVEVSLLFASVLLEQFEYVFP